VPLQLDIFGYTYDDANPAFVDAGTFWFHLPSEKLLTKTSVAAYMASFTPAKTMGATESGSLSSAYTATHLGIPAAAPPAPPAATTGTAITATVAGTKTKSATITFGGGPAPAAGTITLTANAGAAIAGLTPVTVTKGMTAAQAATAVAAALNGKKDAGSSITLAAVSAGAVVTVTEAGNANIATLTAVVA
jgi:hypothetical protein